MRIVRMVSIGLALILATLAPEKAEAQPPGQGDCPGCAYGLVCVEQNETGQCVEWEPATACFHHLETGREDCEDNAPLYTSCNNLGGSCSSSLLLGFIPENAAEGFSGSMFVGYTSCSDESVRTGSPSRVALLSARVPVLIDATASNATATGIQ